jgi:hypothetical protein
MKRMIPEEKQLPDRCSPSPTTTVNMNDCNEALTTDSKDVTDNDDLLASLRKHIASYQVALATTVSFIIGISTGIAGCFTASYIYGKLQKAARSSGTYSVQNTELKYQEETSSNIKDDNDLEDHDNKSPGDKKRVQFQESPLTHGASLITEAGVYIVDQPSPNQHSALELKQLPHPPGGPLLETYEERMEEETAINNTSPDNSRAEDES